MQYVRNLSDSVSTAWNSINPATLSGAIDVIVVEQEDGSLASSPFHVRFGKFSLLRPSDKKVEFKVNGAKQEYSMKLGEGGEAFFVFETTDHIPQSMQTSPLVSPETSPTLGPASADLKEPDNFELNEEPQTQRRPPNAVLHSQTLDDGALPSLATASHYSQVRPASGDWSGHAFRPHSDDILRYSARSADRDIKLDVGDKNEDDDDDDDDDDEFSQDEKRLRSERSQSPPPLSPQDAINRANALARELATVNIPSKVTETGDLMLDMSGFKGSEEDMIRAEVVARNILSKVLDGNYDIGSLFGFDTEGNLWIYSSEEARQAAMKKTMESSLQHHYGHAMAADAVSDPGYQSDGSDISTTRLLPSHRRTESDAGPMDLQILPQQSTPSNLPPRESYRAYAKTLRLTSEQLKDLKLRRGPNTMSFTVNRATCSANMYLWKHEVPVVISDIDGTITKSDALGQVLNMIGRDWTHAGIAKLYSDIAANGYNIMYLTSRSVGQADTTRAYLSNIVQEGFRMPAGPTILSPDRTMAALRREVYLRQPQVFKMATLRDIRNLYGPERTPFYAGYGNRLTDQISYRTVDVPRNRIFTINSNSEVSLDLLTLNKLKMSYVNINEVVDHYFPPVSTLVTGGGEQYTDFMYWRDEPLPLDDFSASDSEESDNRVADDQASQYADDDDDDEEVGDGLGDSYLSNGSFDNGAGVASRVVNISDKLGRTSTEDLEDADDENDEEEEDEDEDDDDDDDDEDDDDDGAYSEDDSDAFETRQKIKTSTQTQVREDVHAELITGTNAVINSEGVKSLTPKKPRATKAYPTSPAKKGQTA